MGNRKIIIIFAVIFTCIFSLFYYVLFQMLGAEESSSRVLYLNQVGIFEESANAEKMCDRLREKDLVPYTLEKEDQLVVVTSIYENEEETKKEGEILKEMDINYLMKKITVEGNDMIEAIDAEKYEQVLQEMENEDTGTGSE